MSRYLSLRILVVVATVVALVGGNCLEIILEIQRKTGGRPLAGGHSRIENPENDKIVMDIVEQGVKEFNQRSNKLLEFKNFGVLNAFIQMVNGLKFCIQFQVTSFGCKNNINSDFCHKKEGHVCVVSAYKAFDEKTANIDRNTMSCVETE